MDNEIHALRQDNIRKDEKIASLESTVAQLKENNAMLAVTKDREIEAMKGEVIETIYVPSEEVAIGFAEWILSNEFIKQADGENQWWGKRKTEDHYTTRELLSIYKESKTNEEKK